jgi:hypothetical protein
MLMNINGLARGLMSSRKSGEEFYLHVVNCIEQQLKEWNEDYEEIKNRFTVWHFHSRKLNLCKKAAPMHLIISYGEI